MDLSCSEYEHDRLANTAWPVVLEKLSGRKWKDMGDLIEEVGHQERDVVLVCDGKEFPAHKRLLAEASPYFAAMFTKEFTEREAEEVILHGVDPSAFALILNRIYGNCPMTDSVVKLDMHKRLQLLDASNMLLLDDIFDECCAVLTWMENASYLFTATDACLLWEAAETVNSDLVAQAAIEVTLQVTIQEAVYPDLFAQFPLERVVRLLRPCDNLLIRQILQPNNFLRVHLSSRCETYSRSVISVIFFFNWLRVDLDNRLACLSEVKQLISTLPVPEIFKYCLRQKESLFEMVVADEAIPTSSLENGNLPAVSERDIMALVRFENGCGETIGFTHTWITEIQSSHKFVSKFEDKSIVWQKKSMFASYQGELWVAFGEQCQLFLAKFDFLKGHWTRVSNTVFEREVFIKNVAITEGKIYILKYSSKLNDCQLVIYDLIGSTWEAITDPNLNEGARILASNGRLYMIQLHYFRPHKASFSTQNLLCFLYHTDSKQFRFENGTDAPIFTYEHLVGTVATGHQIYVRLHAMKWIVYDTITTKWKHCQSVSKEPQGKFRKLGSSKTTLWEIVDDTVYIYEGETWKKVASLSPENVDLLLNSTFLCLNA